ncbi:hypothetical protein MTO96_016432 [Rhipicephalus appendiculatus]
MSSPDTNSLLNLLQISDSAFPTGSFAHSAGLEAAYQRGFLTTSEKVEKFLLASTENVGSFSIPFVREAHQVVDRPRSHSCSGSPPECLVEQSHRQQGEYTTGTVSDPDCLCNIQGCKTH